MNIRSWKNAVLSTGIVINLDIASWDTCDAGTFPQIEMGHQGTVENDHVEPGVVQRGALRHVQVDQGEVTLLPDNVDGGDHRTS